MVGLRQKGVARVGATCLKYLKRGWNRKEGKENKDFKKVMGRGGGAGTPLRIMNNLIHRNSTFLSAILFSAAYFSSR